MKCSCGQRSKDACKQMFDEVLAKEFSDYRYGRVHRLTVDTYSLQHPDTYMRSAKSFAAHLTGMGCAMEYDNDPNLLRLLQQWLSGPKRLSKPEMLPSLGDLTIAHVMQSKDDGEHIQSVREWAEDVWNAYSVYHGLAREWIETAKQESAGK
jgi:hypothetical protein